MTNNHIADFGDEGLKDTFDLREIKYFGAGNQANYNYNNPLIVKDIGVSFHGYCGTIDVAGLDSLGLLNRPAPLDFELIQRDVIFALRHKLKPIVQLHCGIEESCLSMSIWQEN